MFNFVALVVLLLLLPVWPAVTLQVRPSNQDMLSRVRQADTEWLRLAPEREEFSGMTPAPPSVMTQSGNYSFKVGGEKVLERRSYGGYANGFIFVIESYRASRPQEVFDPLLQIAGSKASSERDVLLNGFSGKEYRPDTPRFYGRVLCLLAKRHVYILRLAVLEQNNTYPERFLTAFKLRSQDDARDEGTKEKVNDTSAIAPVTKQEVVNSKELTRRVLVVWKPEPSYTQQARQHQLTGTIILKAIFAADGQVTNIEVLSGLPDGLTEKAVEAARNIRFFPAEKDGRLVSQLLNLEYNFNLY